MEMVNLVLLGKQFLHADSRKLYSKEMEHWKNISENIEKSNNDEDFEELNRTISIYRSIFLNKATSKLRIYIENECREVFYERIFK